MSRNFLAEFATLGLSTQKVEMGQVDYQVWERREEQHQEVIYILNMLTRAFRVRTSSGWPLHLLGKASPE